jgi:AcrR family transcriptional regulator
MAGSEPKPAAPQAGDACEAPKRGRPRSGECHRAVLDAAAEAFERDRYTDVTMEGVAASAGVAKQTLYKWWPSKAKLGMEVYATRILTPIALPDTGDVTRDLHALLLRACRTLRRGNTGSLIAGLIADAQSDEALLHALRDTLVSSRRKLAADILERGIARGQVRPGIDTPFILDLLYGPIWYRLLLQNAPLDDAFVGALVNGVLAGITLK